jgi:hypothetical protein
MAQFNPMRVASSHNFSGIVSHKLCVVLYSFHKRPRTPKDKDDSQTPSGHPQILVENVVVREVNDKGRFKMLKGDIDKANDMLGHNAYRIMGNAPYNVPESALKLMEVIPEPYVQKIASLEAITFKGFESTSTRFVKMLLLDDSITLEGEGRPFVWLNPTDVVKFAQHFRSHDYHEVLTKFGFQLPI